MRRKDREITDRSKIEDILSRAKYLHLGMFDEEYPYVVPLHYGYSLNGDKLTLYVHCANEGHKLDCIKNNANVFVEIDCGEKLIEADIACKYGAEYSSVMCRGRASLVTDVKEKCLGLSLLMKNQTGKNFAIDKRMAESVSVIKIDVGSYTAKARINKA